MDIRTNRQKLFESENELKCKNRLLDFIEALCLISNFLRKVSKPLYDDRL